MRSTMLAVLLLSSAVVATGCATSEEWAEWRRHSSHFASGDHLFFSMKNREGMPPRVTRRELQVAQAEEWWGKVVTVTPEQIFVE